MSFFKDTKELKQLAEKCIKKYSKLEDIKFYQKDIKIGYQWSDEEKKINNKIIYADCEKIKSKLKEFIDYDFIITFYDTANELSPKALELLMYHELRHIGIKSDNRGNVNFYIISHEIEDFYDIIQKNGLKWHEI